MTPETTHQIPAHHTQLGRGVLDTRGATADNYLEPRFVRTDGSEVSTADDVCGYLHRAEGVEYTAEQLAWIDDYIAVTALADKPFDGPWPWCFGATFKTAEQLEEIERRLGRSLALA